MRRALARRARPEGAALLCAALLASAGARAQGAADKAVAAPAAPAPAAPAPAAPAPAAPAPAPSPEEPGPPPRKAWETTRATRRGGFVAGVAIGGGIASIAGYPNDVKKIGLARHYTETGARPAGGGLVWIGGALTDWFTFGVGVTGGRLFTSDDTEAYAGPLFPLGGRWRDVGVMIDVGTGPLAVEPPKGDTKLVDGPATSLVGGGVFWEGVRFWRFAGGPFLAGNYMWSDTARRPALLAGWRMVLYTGP